MVDPAYKWVPSVAPSSLAYYDGEAMPPGWRHTLLIGTLSGERLVRLSLEDGLVVGEEQTLHHRIGRIRNVIAAPDGHVYLLTDGSSAQLFRLEPLSDQVANKGPQHVGEEDAR